MSRTLASGLRITALVSSGAVVLSLIGLTPATAAGPDYQRTAAVAQQAIEASLAATGATSITAGLTDASGVLWQGTTGPVDSSGTPAGPTTRYGIGSTTKMFTTAAVMQLVDAGKVGLDQPVVRYLSRFTMRSPQYRQITVRMLLDHSAGLPGSAYVNGMTTKPYPDYVEDVFAYLSRSSLKSTPGAMSVYCNDCFTLAGELVAEVSGMPYETYVQRNILAPLGMTNSMFITDRMPTPGTVARLVDDSGDTWPQEVTNILASGGLLSTPTDMLAFGRMLLADGRYDGQRILSESSVTQMGHSQLATTLDPLTHNVWNYGLGWDTVDDLTLKAVGVQAWVKGGDTGHYHASLIVAPDVDLAVFVAGAGHYGSGAAQGVAEQILLSALAERGDIPAVPERLGTDQPPAAIPTENDINAALGIYLGSSGLAHRIRRGDGNALFVDTLNNGVWTPGSSTVSFRTDGAWWPDAPRAMSMRLVTGWGRNYLVVATPTGYGSVYGEQVFGERVQPAGAIAAPWRERLGEWLQVGDGPSSMIWLGRPVNTLTRIPGLPGYLYMSGVAPVDARAPSMGSMFLQVPLMWGRDLDDLVPVRPGLMRMGTYAWVERDSLPALRAGRTAIRVGSQGYGEWREIVDASRITIDGADAWYLYDSDVTLVALGGKEATGLKAPAGSLLLVFGEPGDRVDVRSAPRG